MDLHSNKLRLKQKHRKRKDLQKAYLHSNKLRLKLAITIPACSRAIEFTFQ